MSLIANHGDPANPIWVVITEPYEKDSEHQTLFSCGYGYNFKKVWKLAGLPDPYICSVKPCLGATYDNLTRLNMLQADIEQYKPILIVPLDDNVLNFLVPETTQQKEKNSSLRKWAGSLLQSRFIKYPHYVIGSHEPEWVTRNWDYHEIQAFIDFGHVKEEYDFWGSNGRLNPLPQRRLITEPSFTDLLDYLLSCGNLPYISLDIETIRPRKGTFYHDLKHPGYPYTCAIAKSPHDAISFSYWDYPPEQAIRIWRVFDELLQKVPQIGQNYFTFDSHFKEALGFKLCLDRCSDTLIRHHILWPGLEHKLQFQTKQYTREPYYKDEGKSWSSKYKRQLMIYNAKDAAVTYEVWLAQEKEFDDRPHLR